MGRITLSVSMTAENIAEAQALKAKVTEVLQQFPEVKIFGSYAEEV
jgi:hypothetical protein